MNEPDLKTLDRPLQLKDEAKGLVEAIIATLEVVDKDQEIILRTAIPDGSKVKMSSYGHDIVPGFVPGSLPVGLGAVFVEGNKAVFRGRVFQSTDRGRETLAVLKEMGNDCEWSFGFRIIGSELPDEKWRKLGAQRILTKLEVFEVSPVLLGAGIGTGTVSVRAARQAKPDAAQRAEWAALAAESARILARNEKILAPVLTAEECYQQIKAANWKFGFIPEVQVDAERHFAAKGVVAWAAKVLGGRRQDVKWFSWRSLPTSERATRGYFDGRQPSEIWLRSDLRGWDLLSVSIHEYLHAYRHSRGIPQSENSVILDTQYLLQQYAEALA